MKKLRKTHKDLKRTWFGRYILINIFVALLGIPVGIVVLIYLLLFPFDESEYNKYPYFVNRADNIEEAKMTTKRDRIPELIMYYNKSNNPQIKEFSYWSTHINDISFSSKVKVLKEYDNGILKVKVLTYYGSDKKIVKGFIPAELIHDSPPDMEKVVSFDYSFVQQDKFITNDISNQKTTSNKEIISELVNHIATSDSILKKNIEKYNVDLEISNFNICVVDSSVAGDYMSCSGDLNLPFDELDDCDSVYYLYRDYFFEELSEYFTTKDTVNAYIFFSNLYLMKDGSYKIKLEYLFVEKINEITEDRKYCFSRILTYKEDKITEELYLWED